MSAAEAIVNVAVGYGVSVAATLVVLPAFGFAVTPHGAIAISAVFTAVSLVRSYVLRRAFEWISRK